MDLAALRNWSPPETWQKLTSIDAHTAGEPLRIICGGWPAMEGKTILEMRRFTKQNFDHLRSALMLEPRGHADMYGCIITPPVTEEADFGVLFTHNEGFSTMCGHGIIAVTKVALETGLINKNDPLATVRIDTPAGLVTAYARTSKNIIKSVYFHNVPSFVVTLDREIDIPALGKITLDIAFGGALGCALAGDF